MAATDFITRGFEAVGRALGIVRPVDRDGRARGDQPAAVASDLGPLTVDTMTRLRAILRSHDEGDLSESGLLAERLLCDADVQGALLQRVRALQACPTRFHPFDETEAAKAAATEIEAAWGRMVTPAALADLVCGAIFLGASCAQIVWHPVPDAADGRLEPHLEPWPWHALEQRRYEKRWYVHTVDGTVPIDPGGEQWVVFTPQSELVALAWGVVRCLGAWVLRSDFGGSDLSKHAEVHGSPAWVAMVPSAQREAQDAKSFVGGLRRLGRGGVIPAPQGDSKATSYDVRLEQATADGSKVFELVLRIAGGKVRLAILGQDLTSQNNKVGTNASSDSGEGVTDLVVSADARGLSLGPFARLARLWARYRGVPEPRVVIDAEREDDVKKDAEGSKASADAVVAWKAAGVTVDAKAAARMAGMTVIETAPEAPAP
ncbi:MAG: hypothetical protein JWM10_3712 [Myxococcaceae bacterium]|nr:hypothetical protein [Myxococcaceae bacterium]